MSRRRLARPSRWRDWLVILLAIGLMLGGPLGGLYLYGENREQAALEQRVAVVEQQRNSAEGAAAATGDALDEANADRVAQGQQPIVPTATPAPGRPGAAGAPGRDGADGAGPTDTQVRAAVRAVLIASPALASASTAQIATQVAAYLRANPPAPGADGVDGADGVPASEAQIAAAVASYLARNPPAAGADGAPGAAGRGPTVEEIRAAVDAWFAANPPAPGPSGADGAVGAPGQPPLRWSTTRSDGSVETCVRAENFDAAAPTYTCGTNAPSVPTSEPTPSSVAPPPESSTETPPPVETIEP